jgi:hypothetical protein
MQDLSMKEGLEECQSTKKSLTKSLKQNPRPSIGHFHDLTSGKTRARFFQDRGQPRITAEIKKATIPLLEEIALEEVMSELNLPISCLNLGRGEDDHQKTQEYWTNLGIYR